MCPHHIKMNAAFKLLILAFMFYSASAILKEADFGPTFLKKTREWHDICSDVTGASDDNIKQVASGNFVDDEKVQRYILCVWRVTRVMDRNLVVNKALLYQTLPTKELYDKFDAVEEKCLAEAKSKGIKENYKTIYELEKCLYRRQNPEMFLLHLIKMNAAYKLLILAFMVYSAEALLKRKEYGPVFTKVADECHDICIDVTGASDENIKQVGMGHFVDDEKVQRYILCLWRVSRVMDKNLVVNKALLDSILPKKELKDGFDAIEETCLAAAKNKGFKENYETIYDLEKCLYSKQPHEDFIMP